MNNNYYCGKPALIETKLGQGRIIHFGGTFTRENVKAFLDYSGVIEPFEDIISIPAECEVAVRAKEDIKYMFVLNYCDSVQYIELKSGMKDTDTGENVSGIVRMMPYEVKIYQL